MALVDLDGDPASLAPRVRGLRVFAGYAGWDGGQLAGEIARGDWFVVPALPDDVLAPPRYDLWGGVLRRQGVPLALLATHVGGAEAQLSPSSGVRSGGPTRRASCASLASSRGPARNRSGTTRARRGSSATPAGRS